MARLPAALLALAMVPAVAHAADGQLDAGYGNNGRQAIAFDGIDQVQLRGMRRIDGYGRPYLFGSSPQQPKYILLARLLPDGSPDLSFATGGRTQTEVPSLVPAPTRFHLEGGTLDIDGKPIAYGGYRPMPGVVGPFVPQYPGLVCRMFAAGNLDTGFGNGGCTTLRSQLSVNETCTVTGVATAPGSRLLVIGNCQAPDLAERPFIARLKSDGTIDNEFGGGAGLLLPDAPVTDVRSFAFRALQVRPDGRTVVLGELAIETGVSQNLQPGVWQFALGGAPDSGFSGDGFVPASFRDLELNPVRAIDLALDAQGRATVLAEARTASNRRAVLMARFLADGQPDNGFGTEGRVVDELEVGRDADSRLNALALDPSGRALVAGRLSEGISGARDRAATDYWLQFVTPISPAFPPKLWITADTATTGLVRGKRDNLQIAFQVQPGQITEVELPLNYNPENNANHIIDDIGVHITASAPIVVQAFGGRGFSTDSFALLPTSELGNDYRIHAWGTGLGRGSALTVVATAEGTTSVAITPSVDVEGHAAGQTYAVNLQQGQIYRLTVLEKDLSGTRLTSTKPVAVFAGHTCGTVPNKDFNHCEQLTEQMVPVSRWGADFVVVPVPGRVSGDVVTVLAHESGTLLSIDGASTAQLSAGETFSFNLFSPRRIRSTRPVSVMQFAKGCSADQFTGQCVGDPAMFTVRPGDSWSRRQVAVVPPYPIQPIAWEGGRQHIWVIARASDVGQLTWNGVAISPGQFTAIGDGEHVTTSFPVATGVHVLESPSPFASAVYGAKDEGHAYGFPVTHAPPPGQLPDSDDMLVRYLPDGSRDGSFGIGGFAVFDHGVAHPTAITSVDDAVALLVDSGQVVVGSHSTSQANGSGGRMVSYRIDASSIFRDGFEDSD